MESVTSSNRAPAGIDAAQGNAGSKDSAWAAAGRRERRSPLGVRWASTIPDRRTGRPGPAKSISLIWGPSSLQDLCEPTGRGEAIVTGLEFRHQGVDPFPLQAKCHGPSCPSFEESAARTTRSAPAARPQLDLSFFERGLERPRAPHRCGRGEETPER